MADKQFVGSTRVKTTKYGQIINLGLNASDLEKLKGNLNDRGWVNIDLKSRKTVASMPRFLLWSSKVRKLPTHKTTTCSKRLLGETGS